MAREKLSNLVKKNLFSFFSFFFAATLLDPRNMPDLNCIPPDQHYQAWALLRSMVIAVIDEVKN